ncbi:immunoglobulin I-set domain protein, partial [Opisthorchis viverrini]
GASGPEGKIVSVGDPVILECVPPAGLPEPTVYWMKNNEPVLESRRIVIQETGALRIDPVGQVDAGLYHCGAENPVDRWRSRDASLVVQRKTRFKFSPGSKQVFVGDTVEFQCLASDDPNSTIFWRREGAEIPKTSVLNRQSLRIENVQLSYEGNYICEAKTSTTRVEAVAHLSVISPPSFLITPEDRYVPEGTSVLLDCSVSGMPPPLVRWLHNGRTFWVPKPGELKSMSLVPVIEIGPQNQTLQVGMTATLPCHVTLLRHVFLDSTNPHTAEVGDLPADPRVEWFVNGVPVSTLDDHRILRFASGSLQIISVRLSDAGTYTCRAEVDDFRHPPCSTSWSAMIRVVNSDQQSPSNSLIHNYDTTSLPKPPERVSVLDVGDTWILVDILSPNMTTESTSEMKIFPPIPISGFRVEVAQYNTSSGWEVIVPLTTDSKVRLSGLRPETGYYILVRGVGKWGVGKPFVLRKPVFTTQSMVYSSDNLSSLNAALQQIQFNPINMRSISPSEIFTEWLVCGPLDALPLSGFKTTVRAVSLSNCLKRDSQRGISIREDDIRLETYGSGCSPPEAFALTSNDDYLLHCSIGELSKTSNLDRTPPQFLSREDIHVTPFFRSTPIVKFIIDALRPFTCYLVEIEGMISHATSGQAFSKRSYSSAILTYDSPPLGAPRVMNVRWLKNGSVLDVTWHPPAEWEQGGVLTGYVVRILSSTPLLNQNIRLGPEHRTFQINNLDPWVNYTIYLAAVNCRGEGVRSLPIVVFPFPTRPSREHGKSGSPFQTDSTHVPVGDHSLNYPLYRRVIFDGREAVPEHSRSQRLDVSGNSEYDLQANREATGDSLTREPWFVVSVIAFVLLWVLIVLGLILYGRHRSRQQRRRAERGDLGIVTKNGRLVASPDMYGPAFVPSSWPSSAAPESHPLVSAFDTNYYAGEKSVMENAYSALLNPAAPGLLPGMAFAASPMVNGNNTHLGPSYCHNSKSYTLGQPNTAYVTSNSIPANVPNVASSGFTPIIGNDSHMDSHTTSHRPIPVLPNGGVQLPARYDPTAPNKPSLSDLDNEDTVTPYASVPVMQQMVAFDRVANATTSANLAATKPNTITDHMGVVQPSLAPVGRQLSLAEIIPPPPDYPPPSVPSSSPPPPAHSDRQTPMVWARTAATAAGGSGSGDDSAYYAPHQALSQQSNFKSSTDTSQHRTPPHWSCSLPASDESATALLPLHTSPYQDSKLMICPKGVKLCLTTDPSELDMATKACQFQEERKSDSEHKCRVAVAEGKHKNYQALDLVVQIPSHTKKRWKGHDAKSVSN